MIAYPYSRLALFLVLGISPLDLVFAWCSSCRLAAIQDTHSGTFSRSYNYGSQRRHFHRTFVIGNSRNNGSRSAITVISSDSTIDHSSMQSQDNVEFSDDEKAQIVALHRLYRETTHTSETSVDTDQDLRIESIVLEALPTMRPSLLVKLRQIATDNAVVKEDQVEVAIDSVARHLQAVLNRRLDLARATLSELLNAGELRKLDAAIGSAARSGRLDMAFFSVLDINLRDAMQNDVSITGSTLDNVDAQAASSGKDENVLSPPPASRTQILRHVYTRCQEEMEKTLPPGTALLHKLLRTEQASIRANLYRHYLTPSPTTITSPDGKVIDLGTSSNTTLVAVTDFVQALDAAVLQIRTLENVPGTSTDRASAALMVENCRQVAKEARSILGQVHGRDSDPVRSLEVGLQHVFRPSSPSSPYIQGQNV
jgi:hypothetical protein